MGPSGTHVSNQQSTPVLVPVLTQYYYSTSTPVLKRPSPQHPRATSCELWEALEEKAVWLEAY